jgi:hypothetical protein
MKQANILVVGKEIISTQSSGHNSWLKESKQKRHYETNNNLGGRLGNTKNTSKDNNLGSR